MAIEAVKRQNFLYAEGYLTGSAIFEDLNFLLYFKYTLKLEKKLEFKTKNLKAEKIKKRIRQI